MEDDRTRPGGGRRRARTRPGTMRRRHLAVVPDSTQELGAALAELAAMEALPEFVRASPQVEADGLRLVSAARLAAEEEGRLAAWHRDEATRHAVRRDRLEQIAAVTESVIFS